MAGEIAKYIAKETGKKILKYGTAIGAGYEINEMVNHDEKPVVHKISIEIPKSEDSNTKLIVVLVLVLIVVALLLSYLVKILKLKRNERESPKSKDIEMGESTSKFAKSNATESRQGVV